MNRPVEGDHLMSAVKADVGQHKKRSWIWAVNFAVKCLGIIVRQWYRQKRQLRKLPICTTTLLGTCAIGLLLNAPINAMVPFQGTTADECPTCPPAILFPRLDSSLSYDDAGIPELPPCNGQVLVGEDCYEDATSPSELYGDPTPIIGSGGGGPVTICEPSGVIIIYCHDLARPEIVVECDSLAYGCGTPFDPVDEEWIQNQLNQLLLDHTNNGLQVTGITVPWSDTDGDGIPHPLDDDGEGTPPWGTSSGSAEAKAYDDDDGDGVVNGVDMFPLGWPVSAENIPTNEEGIPPFHPVPLPPAYMDNPELIKNVVDLIAPGWIFPPGAFPASMTDSNGGQFTMNDFAGQMAGWAFILNAIHSAGLAALGTNATLQDQNDLKADLDGAKAVLSILQGGISPQAMSTYDEGEASSEVTDVYGTAADGMKLRIGSEGLEAVMKQWGLWFAKKAIETEDGRPGYDHVIVDELGNELDADGYNHLIDQLVAYTRNSYDHLDPVKIGNGAFIYEATDISIEGVNLNLQIKRVYNSRATTSGSCGPNWLMPLLDTKLLLWPSTPTDSYIGVQWGDGSEGLYKGSLDGTYWEGTEGEFGRIRYDRSSCSSVLNSHGLEMRRPTGEVYVFCPPAQPIGGAAFQVSYLRKIVDVNGNYIAFHRDAIGRVVKIVDTRGRTLNLEYGSSHGLLTKIIDWNGAETVYSYGTGGALARVDYPDTLYLDQSGSVATGAPYEAYSYADTSVLSALNYVDNQYTSYNLTSIDKGNGAVVDIEYYNSPGIEFDRVKAQTADGLRTTYLYTAAPSLGQPEIIANVLVREPDGELSRYHFGRGLVQRKETYNGRFSTNYVLIAGSQVPNGPAGVFGSWIETYAYNSDYMLTAILKSNSDAYPNGKLTTYEYDENNGSRFAQRNLIKVTRYPDFTDQVSSPRIEITEYDPVLNTPNKVIDPIGRETVSIYSHQELSYSSALAAATVAGWGVLPSVPMDAASWGLPDQNGDGVVGGAVGLVKTVLPEIVVSSDAGPGTTSVSSPEVTQVLNSRGQITETVGYSGIKIAFTYDSSGHLVAQSVQGALGGVSTTTIERDDKGRTTKLVGPEGYQTEYVYDTRDRLIEENRTAPASGEGSRASIFLLPVEQGEQEHVHQGCSGRGCGGDQLSSWSFYDIEGRFVGSTSQFIPAASETYSIGYSPKLTEKAQYSAAGARESVTRNVYDAGTVLSTGATTIEYSGLQLPATVTEPSGGKLEAAYSPRGLITGIERVTEQGVSEGWTLFGRNKHGEVERIEVPDDSDDDGNNDFVTYEYNGFGELVAENDYFGRRAEYVIDGAGRITEKRIVHDGMMVSRVNHVLDPWDRVVETKAYNFALRSDGTVEPLTPAFHTFEYGWGYGGSALAWARTTDGSQSRLKLYEYDEYLRRSGVFDSLDKSVGSRQVFDKDGRILESTVVFDGEGRTGIVSPSEVTWSYAYDAFGFQSDVIDPDGNQVHYLRNALGLVKQMEDVLGRVTNYKYNSMGQLIRETKVTVAGNRVQQHQYDVKGNLLASIDPLNRTTSFGYDSFGRLISRTYPDGSQEIFGHDSLGRLDSVALPGGIARTYEYNSDSQVSKIVATGNAADVTQEFGYDQLGHLVYVSDETGGRPKWESAWEYSSLGAVQSEDASGVLGVRRFTYGYNALGEQDELNYPSGTVVESSYDSIGRTVSVGVQNGILQTTYSDHYGLSKCRTITHANGGVVAVEYDALQRATSRKLNDSMGAPLMGADYNYNPAGDLLDSTDYVSGRFDDYFYDAFDRLKRWRRGYTGASQDRTIIWNRDLSGNLATYIDSAGYGPYSVSSNSLNQIDDLAPVAGGITYSAAGNEISRSTLSGVVTREWDALSRPFSQGGQAGQCSYSYDGLNRLVEIDDGVSGNTRQFYYAKSQIATLEHSQFGVTEFIPGRYSMAPSGRVNGSDSGYYFADPFGNVSGLFGGVPAAEQYSYTPFGVRLDSSGAPFSGTTRGNELFFLASVLEPFGSYALGPRHLDPVTTNFTSRDPLRESGGQHLYLYAAGNPFRWHDKSGLQYGVTQDSESQAVEGGATTSTLSDQGIFTEGSFADTMTAWMAWRYNLDYTWENAGPIEKILFVREITESSEAARDENAHWGSFARGISNHEAARDFEEVAEVLSRGINKYLGSAREEQVLAQGVLALTVNIGETALTETAAAAGMSRGNANTFGAVGSVFTPGGGGKTIVKAIWEAPKRIANAVRSLKSSYDAWRAARAARAVATTAKAALNSAFEIAEAGGRHAGFLRQARSYSPSEFSSSYRSLSNRLDEHRGFIADPYSHVPDFDSLDPRRQQGLLSHWAKEIQNFSDQLDILDSVKGL